MEFNFDLGIDDQAQFVRETRQFNVGDLLRKAVRKYGDRTAIAEPGREVTYRELNERVNGLTNALLDRGCAPEAATVAVLAENRGEVAEVMYAGAKGGWLVPALNWRLNREELVHCVDLVEPDILIVSEQYRDKLAWLDADAESDPEYVFLDDPDDDELDYEDLVAAGATTEPLPDRRIDPEQGLVVLNTSGTTGLPKAVVISHRCWLARAYKNIIDFGLEEHDDQLIWPPMFHMISADFIPTIATLGGTYYPMDSFDVERVYDILTSEGSPIAWMVLLPGVVEQFLDYAEEHDIGRDDIRELRNIGALVDLVDPKKVERVTKKFDMPFKNSYGATENDNALSGGHDVPVGVRPGQEEYRKVESSFIDMKLIDEDWNDIDGNHGELAVRGPSVCSGYIKNPEANREDFNNGWFRTGDIFRRHDDGTYSFLNRRKYLIKSGGENIYPAELEEVLISHELVEDAITVRVPDEKWGEVPRAVVSTNHPEDLEKDELMALLRDRLAGYKLPHYIDIVAPGELPRSATGKLVREDIEEWELDDEERVREV
ncbi:class I adenylate-forming enzyme family protein [Halorarius litoreus]|uniref:class I adenylate-forming enzyme family protein n=1 Tax=Halorarius litoreus TaxID=2962676 RepID=UPI0020CED875|nr:class I adenylate-forming enzyme family protein [Halorarius litoreus]